MDQGTIRYLLLLLVFIAGGGIYSFLFSKITRNAILLYLPTILGGLGALYFLYLIYFTQLEGFLDIAYFIMVTLLVAVILGNVIVNLFTAKGRKRARR